MLFWRYSNKSLNTSDLSSLQRSRFKAELKFIFSHKYLVFIRKDPELLGHISPASHIAILKEKEFKISPVFPFILRYSFHHLFQIMNFHNIFASHSPEFCFSSNGPISKPWFFFLLLLKEFSDFQFYHKYGYNKNAYLVAFYLIHKAVSRNQ